MTTYLRSVNPNFQCQSAMIRILLLLVSNRNLFFIVGHSTIFSIVTTLVYQGLNKRTVQPVSSGQ